VRQGERQRESRERAREREAEATEEGREREREDKRCEGCGRGPESGVERHEHNRPFGLAPSSQGTAAFGRWMRRRRGWR